LPWPVALGIPPLPARPGGGTTKTGRLTSSVAGSAWPLTGRARELATVADALGGARPRSLVLVGPAGVGKTRLAREARGLAERAGRTTLWVTGTHSTARTPLGAFASLLPGTDGDAAAADTVQDLVRRSARALVARAAGRPLVLFVDDAQLLDEVSAGLIHTLVASEAVTVVLTVRSGEPTPEPVTALWKDDLAIRVELPHLGGQAIQSLLGNALGGQVDPAAVVELTARSGGNVLFLRELVLGALADSSLVNEEGVWRLRSPLSPSDRLVELVAARLQGLDEQSLAMLQLAAYAEPLGSRELTMAGGPAVVEDLERHGLLVSEYDDRRVQVRLAHPLYADVVRRGISAVRQAAMGRMLADAVEAAGGRRREDPLRIGIWRMDGGGGSPEVLLRAAHAARWRYDFTLTERLARCAVDAGAGFDARLLEAQSLALQGRPEDAAERLTMLAEFARTDQDRVRLAVVHIECLWTYLGRPTEGMRVIERAEAAISDPALRRQVSARRSGLVLAGVGPGQAAEAALELLEGADPRSASWIYLVSAYGLSRLGRVHEALDTAELGYDAATHLEPGDWYPWYYQFTRCESLTHLGRFAEAEELARQQYEQGLHDGSSEARAYFLWSLARPVRERGHVVPAAREAREAITLLRRLGRRGFEHSLRSTLALSLALAGDHREASRALVSADKLDVEQPQWSTTDHLAARAWAAVAEGRLGAARDQLTEAADAGERIGDLIGTAAALHDVARLGGAAAVRDRLTALASAIDGDLITARVAHVEGLCASDPEQLAAVAEDFDRLGAPLLAAEAAADSAVAWRRAERSQRADAELHRAAAFARGCEGAVTPALAPIASREQLTPAERETALLAVSGRTNREIAEELHLSVRTVDNRLQRIYAKLGISRRSDLADLVR
jgi:DNA-binding CsgD family transcriptional regulator